ncbi:SDR family NAD(P)-dependent oxidoreductase [Salinicoccus sp. HZC-1]|uniref:SDR family NAD(P)-dependent oxidoreductase n=1 Tax=Salinicoccus sp. HZC-1 TaxID=3385497 RepID=UPI00398A93AF
MRYVFITGTTRGLGQSLLEAFKEDRIISISRREVETDVDIYKEHHIDFLDETAMEDDIPEIFSSISPEKEDEIYLINNAGTVNPVKSVENMDVKGYLDNYKVNVLAPALFIKGFIKAFKDLQSEKRILTVSSGAAVNPMEGWAAYCTSKAAINMLSGVTRLETGDFEYPILSATFRPGVIDTDMQKTIRSSDPDEFPNIDKFKSYKSDQRLLAPDHVASVLKQIITSERYSETANYDINDYM